MIRKITLNELYDIMYDHLDPNGWWPGRSDWEVIWSTVLIQNTNWNNVNQALASLYKACDFDPQKILTMPTVDLKDAIRSAGFYERKSQTIKNMAKYFSKYDFNLDQARERSKAELRKDLLTINGIGLETADVILLYALYKGEFVVDKYSRRLFACLGCRELPAYEKIKPLLEKQLSGFTLRQWQNFHALIDIFNQKYALPQDFESTFLAGYQLDLKTNQ